MCVVCIVSNVVDVNVWASKGSRVCLHCALLTPHPTTRQEHSKSPSSPKLYTPFSLSLFLSIRVFPSGTHSESGQNWISLAISLQQAHWYWQWCSDKHIHAIHLVLFSLTLSCYITNFMPLSVNVITSDTPTFSWIELLNSTYTHLYLTCNCPLYYHEYVSYVFTKRMFY